MIPLCPLSLRGDIFLVIEYNYGMKEDESQEITIKGVEFDLDALSDDHVRSMTSEELIPTLIGVSEKTRERDPEKPNLGDNALEGYSKS
jgi:hypothetical protein